MSGLIVPFALFTALLPVGDEPAWEELRLENGIQCTLLHAPLAPQQAVFSFLPLGLLGDEPDHAQYSHLAEHMLLRSTDPGSLEVDGLLLNGETTGLQLRLECFVAPERWTEGLSRHVSWLTARSVDGEVLAREKAAIAGEQSSTVSAGYTHKWALAAWNQVVRHGRSHAAVARDVGDASVGSTEAYLRQHVGSGADMRVVSVGPVPLAEARAALQAAFGGLPDTRAAAVPSALPPEEVLAVGVRHATWDLPARHYLEWYPVPSDTPLERVQVDALAQVVNVRLSQRGRLESIGVHVLAQADLVSPEGRWFLISASLPEGVDVALLRSELDDVLDGLRPTADVGAIVRQLAVQLLELPDFAEVRKELGSHPAAAWIEAQQVLYMMYAQANMGLDRDTLRAVYPQLNAEGVIDVARQVFGAGKRSSLLLAPGP